MLHRLQAFEISGEHGGIDGLMAILVFVFSLILLIAAVASGYQSIDLLPTSTGVLYALAGAVAACAAVVTFAIAVMIRRIDALTKLMRQSSAPAPLEVTPLSEIAPTDDVVATPSAVETKEAKEAGEEPAAEDERPININRTGHLPSLETVDTVLETPEEPQAPPSLIGSYSSAGTNYKIFSDGSIEAETSEGRFKFASMADFKRHLVETKGNREVSEEATGVSAR
jgi:hypothetical protein